MKERPSYGYKRVTAMVNKRFDRTYNRKRIYRLMRKGGLLLPRPGRVTVNSNGGQSRI